jgi:DNA invertase Pin-like site-specific DNA recombinase
MSSHNGNGHFRVGGYCRTSGESQRDNTSIPVQKQAIEAFCKANGWRLVKFYVDEAKSGSKIAGREAFQEMVADAEAGGLDVLAPYDSTRFARDGVDILDTAKRLKKGHGVFTVDTKGQFDNRHHHRTLGNFVFAGVTEHERLSILERTSLGKIRRAQEGAPVNARGPWGRIWDKKAKTWGIDREKQAKVQDAARRYLEGESMKELAVEFGMSHAFLHRLLTRMCGPVWVQHVRCLELGIDEPINTEVPPLLDAGTIKAILARAEANKTFNRGQLKHRYLLSHVVFCAHCGRPMFGHAAKGGRFRYYRHHHHRDGRQCDRPMSWVDADGLEHVIMLELFDTFGNPRRVQAAIKEAVPNQAKVEAERERHGRLTLDLGKIDSQRQRVVDAIADGRLTAEQSRKKLDNLAAQETALEEELKRIAGTLANVPTAEEVKKAAEQIKDKVHKYANKRRGDAVLAAARDAANHDIDGMTWEERRALVQMVFGGKTADGRRLGVYVSWPETPAAKGRPKEWNYRIEGRLAFAATGSCPVEPYDGEFQGAPRQKALLDDEATQSTHSS